jgi:hypothetical protein
MRMNLPPDVLKATIGHIYLHRSRCQRFTTVPRDGAVPFCTSNIQTACRHAENQMSFYRETASDPGSAEGQMLKCALQGINNSVEKLSPVHSCCCEVNYMDEP